MERQRVNKLYRLSITVISNPILVAEAHLAIKNFAIKTTDLALISSSYYNDPALWHKRMEHISFAVMQKWHLKAV